MRNTSPSVHEEQAGQGPSPAISMLLGGPSALPGVPTSPVAIWAPFGPGRPGAADAVETQALPAVVAPPAARGALPSGTAEVLPVDILSVAALGPQSLSLVASPRPACEGTQEVGAEDVLEEVWARPTANLHGTALAHAPASSASDVADGAAMSWLDAPRAGFAHPGPSPWGHGLPSLVADDDEPEPERVPISLAPVAFGSSSAPILAVEERRSPALLVWLAAIVVASVLGASLAFFLAARNPSRAAASPAAEATPARPLLPASPTLSSPEPSPPEPAIASAVAPDAVAGLAPRTATSASSIAVDALPKPGLGGGMGLLTFAPSARRHRVYLDGRLLQSGVQPTRVTCGAHRVRIGSHGRTQRVEVPCGGDVEVAK